MKLTRLDSFEGYPNRFLYTWWTFREVIVGMYCRLGERLSIKQHNKRDELGFKRMI